MFESIIFLNIQLNMFFRGMNIDETEREREKGGERERMGGRERERVGERERTGGGE